ncbi:hypothetical protein [Enterobacter soli]|uniref:hypothetical protein n=1 Tax=Enterobacter soli TaxID=885040 RepID=UPI002F42D114
MNKNDELMMRFRREIFAPNGKREMTSTSDVDAGLANVILNVLNDVVVSDDRQSAKPLKQFLTRSPRDKLKIGQFDDVETFLRAMRTANGGRRDDENTSFSNVNADALPVLNLGRAPGFQLHDNSHATEDYNVGGITNADGKTVALLSLMPVEISYSIMVLANEKETLSALTGIIVGWLRQFAAWGATHFEAKSQVAGASVVLECSLRDVKAVMINDLSGQINDSRIYAATIPITVIAPLYTAWLGEQKTGVIDVINNGVTYTTTAPGIPSELPLNLFGEVV